MRTVHHLVILLALTARSVAAVALRKSTTDRIACKPFPWKRGFLRMLTTITPSALTHTPERFGFFGREKVCREACASRMGNRGPEDLFSS